MDDELKIVIKAVLDDNTEKDLNSQLKNINLDPISPEIKLKANTSKAKKTVEKTIKDVQESVAKKARQNNSYEQSVVWWTWINLRQSGTNL